MKAANALGDKLKREDGAATAARHIERLAQK